MKLVKVARVGGKVQEVVVRKEATIAECLAAAGMRKEVNEEVFENHIPMNVERNALPDSVIILEIIKREPLSYGLTRFINALMLEDIIDGEDYENEECEININDIYNNEKDMIDNLIKKAKEA